MLKSYELAFIITLYLVTPKSVLWQTVNAQMKCRIMLHFIRVYTVCRDKNDLQRKKHNIFLQNYNPSIYTMDHPKFIVSNQTEESIKA